MANRTGSSPGIGHTDAIWGWGYWAFQLFLLPSLLSAINGALPRSFSTAEVNFLYFLINFLVVLLIFHKFLGSSFRQVTAHPAYFCQAVILGLAAYAACSYVVSLFIHTVDPSFVNANDDSIASMSRGSFFLMFLGTVILAPVAEECFYRGLFFRTLSGKSLWAAYLCSILVFAAIHVVGYIGAYSPLTLVLSFLQYLPAGLCLAWSYTKAGTIFAPILIHMLINAYGIYQLR